MAGVLTEDPVTATLRDWGRTRLKWGETDCAMSVFEYLANHHERPQAWHHWRGRYHSEDEAKASMRAIGGPVRAFQAEAARCGLTRTRAPGRGDVGLVRDGNRKLVAGICIGDGKWAARVASGFCVHAFEPLVAYSVGARHG